MAAAPASRSERLRHRFQPPALVGYSPGLLARRFVLGAMISAGLLVIIGTELRHALTDEPHDLSLLAFGVSLVLLPVVTAAISSIVASRRLSTRARSSA